MQCFQWIGGSIITISTILWCLGAIVVISILVIWSYSSPTKVRVKVIGIDGLNEYNSVPFVVYRDHISIDDELIIPMDRVLYADGLFNYDTSGLTSYGRYKTSKSFELTIHYKMKNGKKSSFVLRSEHNPSITDASFNAFVEIKNKINFMKGYKENPIEKNKKVKREI